MQTNRAKAMSELEKEIHGILNTAPLCISSTRHSGTNGLRNADEITAKLMPIIQAQLAATKQELENQIHDTKQYMDIANELGAEIVAKDRVIETCKEAIRGSLGYFALFNDDEDKFKWPRYVILCEQALASIAELETNTNTERNGDA